MAMRWFNGLRMNSIDSYRQLTQAFGSRFVTNSRPPWPMSALLSQTMRDRETLKAYSDKYWEIYNELDGKYDNVAINTFKNRLSIGHGLRNSLTGKPATSVRQLMDRIDKYKQVEEDLLQGKGKEKFIPQEMRDSRSDQYNNARPKRDFIGQSGATNAQAVGAVFRELLIWEGKLKHLLHHSSGHQGQTYQELQRDTAIRQPAGTINVILTAPGRTGTRPSRVLSVTQVPVKESQSKPKRARRGFHPTLSFSEEEKDGTTQPHDDALAITLRIGEYDIRRVMVDGGSVAEVMYPNLYKGLGLKREDLTPYSSPLMSFDGKLVIPKGVIRLPIQTGPEVVEVEFIVVDTYSPYTAIVGRSWPHTLGGVASSLHQKVKFSSKGRVLEIRGYQSTARRCMVAATSHRHDAESSAVAIENL
nr:uncharacterized protein LOC112040197 [Quercus suber]